MTVEALPAKGRRRPASPLASFRARLQAPLYRNGYAIVLSSGLTSALGLLYWVVATRLYSPAAVGLSAALISAMTLLANISQLNLKGALNRFLPRAGAGSGRLVTRSYLVTFCISGLASLIFLAGIDIWSPRLAFLTDRPELALCFVAATMAWTTFVLQDSVLAGIRQAGWVPVENLTFSVAKILLLFAFVATAPVLGVFVSWIVPVFMLIVPVNLLLFRRLIPRHVRATRGREEPVPARRIARYVAADYAAYSIWSATIDVLPLIVLSVLGATANAYFFVSWSIAYSLYLITSGMGMSMIAEASLDPERLHEHRRRALLETARLVVPAAVLLVVAAPAILDLLGDGYSGEAVTLLRLLAVSAVPYIIVGTYVNVARVERRMRTVVITYAILCGLVLALGLPLLSAVGINGLGIAWLAAQSVVAAVIVAAHLARGERRDWRGHALRALSGARRWTLHWARRLGSAGVLRPVLESLRHDRQERWTWGVRGHLRVLNDVTVSMVGPPGCAPEALVKRACTEGAERGLRRQERVLRLLEREPGLTSWSRLVPSVIASGSVRGRRFLMETIVPGTSSEQLLRGGAGGEQCLVATEQAIRPLHEATRALIRVDEPQLRQWIDAPIARLRATITDRSQLVQAEAGLERLARELREGLVGRVVATSWIHGDLCPANVLMGPGGADVQGIVDWEQAEVGALPQLDLVHLLLTTRMAIERREFGDVVTDFLRAPDWREEERPLARALESRDASAAASIRALALLTWLHHAAGNVAKSARYSRSRIWVRRNVDPVLDAILRSPLPATVPARGAVTPTRPRRHALAARLRARTFAIGATRLGLAASLGALSLALALWLTSLGSIDPRAMTDIGLVAVLPPAFYVALLVLTASFAALAHKAPQRTWLLGSHLLALVVVLHATPALVYGTVRYSWAWKHVGIVDYIQRHGGVNTNIDYLSAYHNWPGFFGLDAMLVELAGLAGTVDLAVWGPVFFNVLNLAAVVFVFSALTRDRRVVWLASWLFFIASWVGQDYFSPQAFAFALYLFVLGIVLRWLRASPRASEGEGPPDPLERRRRAGIVALAVLLLAAIASSHALTSVTIAIALGGLVLARVCAVRSLALVAVGATALWNAVFAWDFVSPSVSSTVDSIGLPWVTSESSLTSISRLSDGQAMVATISRGVVAVIATLAVFGVLRQLRGRELNRAALVLMLAPLLLFASGDYDGEILFRIYLFSVPFLAFFAAVALPGLGGAEATSWKPALAFTALGAIVLAGFLFAYYGKERQYYFTPGEVAAADHLYSHAPSNSLLIEGTRNYPGQLKNYERFDYVPLSREPPATHARFARRPEAVFSQWMSNPRYDAAFLIISRGQKAEVEELGVLPPGTLERIERALLRSARFQTLFRNRDATVFTLAGASSRSSK